MVKKPGRPKTRIDAAFYVREPDRVMLALCEMKNAGRSWQQISDLIGFSKSPAALWKIAKGVTSSKEVERLLGFGYVSGRWRLAADFASDEERELFRRQVLNGKTFTQWVMKKWSEDNEHDA